MSYPGSFSKHHFGDGGTDRMAYKGDNIGSCGDEESSSYSSGAFGEFLSCMDANRVLTWLRLVGESWADAF